MFMTNHIHLSPGHCKLNLNGIHEREKRRAYDEHVRELAFHRLCLQMLVAWPTATTVFRKFASMLG